MHIRDRHGKWLEGLVIPEISPGVAKQSILPENITSSLFADKSSQSSLHLRFPFPPSNQFRVVP